MRGPELSLLALINANRRLLDENCKKLNLNNLQLRRIDILPISISNCVHILYLSTNYLTSLRGIDQFTSLQVLSLANNDICYYHELKPLSNLPLLKKISLVNNPVAFLPFYREHVISLCQRVDFLDDLKVTSDERKASVCAIARVSSSLEQLTLCILRVSVLSHFAMLRQCHLTMKSEIFPKYRSIAAQHIGLFCSSDDSVISNASCVLRHLLQGGVFRQLLISSRHLIELSAQNLLRKAHEKCLAAMCENEKSFFRTSRTAREIYWNDLIGESLKMQQLELLMMVDRVDNAFLMSNFPLKQRIDAFEPVISATPNIFRQSDFKASLISLMETINLGDEMQENIGCGIGKTCETIKSRTLNISNVSSSQLPPQQQEPPYKEAIDVSSPVVVQSTVLDLLKNRRHSDMNDENETKIKAISSKSNKRILNNEDLLLSVNLFQNNLSSLEKDLKNLIESDFMHIAIEQFSQIPNYLRTFSHKPKDIYQNDLKSMQQYKVVVNLCIDELSILQREEQACFRNFRTYVDIITKSNVLIDKANQKYEELFTPFLSVALCLVRNCESLIDIVLRCNSNNESKLTGINALEKDIASSNSIVLQIKSLIIKKEIDISATIRAITEADIALNDLKNDIRDNTKYNSVVKGRALLSQVYFEQPRFRFGDSVIELNEILKYYFEVFHSIVISRRNNKKVRSNKVLIFYLTKLRKYMNRLKFRTSNIKKQTLFIKSGQQIFIRKSMTKLFDCMSRVKASKASPAISLYPLPKRIMNCFFNWKRKVSSEIKIRVVTQYLQIKKVMNSWRACTNELKARRNALFNSTELYYKLLCKKKYFLKWFELFYKIKSNHVALIKLFRLRRTFLAWKICDNEINILSNLKRTYFLTWKKYLSRNLFDFGNTLAFYRNKVRKFGAKLAIRKLHLQSLSAKAFRGGELFEYKTKTKASLLSWSKYVKSLQNVRESNILGMNHWVSKICKTFFQLRNPIIYKTFPKFRQDEQIFYLKKSKQAAIIKLRENLSRRQSRYIYRPRNDSSLLLATAIQKLTLNTFKVYLPNASLNYSINCDSNFRNLFAISSEVKKLRDEYMNLHELALKVSEKLYRLNKETESENVAIEDILASKASLEKSLKLVHEESEFVQQSINLAETKLKLMLSTSEVDPILDSKNSDLCNRKLACEIAISASNEELLRLRSEVKEKRLSASSYAESRLLGTVNDVKAAKRANFNILSQLNDRNITTHILLSRKANLQAISDKYIDMSVLKDSKIKSLIEEESYLLLKMESLNQQASQFERTLEKLRLINMS